MALSFDQSGIILFDSKYDGSIKLHKTTWERHILAHAERAQFKFNDDKIATTLINPDHVRESKSDGPEVHLYYKEFPRWRINEVIEIPVPPPMRYFVVVVGTKKKLILTVYAGKIVKFGKSVGGES